MNNIRAQALAQGLKRAKLNAACAERKAIRQAGEALARRAVTSERVDRERAKAREYQRAYYAAHKEKVNEASKRWRRNHPEHVQARKRDYRLTHLEAVRERDREWYRAWYRKNPGAARAKEAKRRALLKQQRCTCCTDAEIRHFHDIAALCGPGAEVDHRIPLKLGGLDCAKNLEALTYEEHKVKTGRDQGLIADARRRSRAAKPFSGQEYSSVDVTGL